MLSGLRDLLSPGLSLRLSLFLSICTLRFGIPSQKVLSGLGYLFGPRLFRRLRAGILGLGFFSQEMLGWLSSRYLRLIRCFLRRRMRR